MSIDPEGADRSIHLIILRVCDLVDILIFKSFVKLDFNIRLYSDPVITIGKRGIVKARRHFKTAVIAELSEIVNTLHTSLPVCHGTYHLCDLIIPERRCKKLCCARGASVGKHGAFAHDSRTVFADIVGRNIARGIRRRCGVLDHTDLGRIFLRLVAPRGPYNNVVLVEHKAEDSRNGCKIAAAVIPDVEQEIFTARGNERIHWGDTSTLDTDDLKTIDVVADVKRVSEPFKLANRKFHPDNSIFNIAGRTVGEGHFSVIAGPCSVETVPQMTETAEAVKKSGASFLRGGAFKPRTSPYSFQGLHDEGLKILLEAKKATGLPIVTEIMNQAHLDLFEDVDIIQVGARNMQNFELLKELGKCNKPILLKRGLSSTIEEWVMSAEYIMAGGNEQVIFCERGIRTYETFTRNTLDLSAIPALKSISHLPVIVDPSHATGLPWMVEPLTKAAIAIGADGIMIEVHNNPKKALCDGAQSLTPQQFDNVMQTVKKRVEFEGKILG